MSGMKLSALLLATGLCYAQTDGTERLKLIRLTDRMTKTEDKVTVTGAWLTESKEELAQKLAEQYKKLVSISCYRHDRCETLTTTLIVNRWPNGSSIDGGIAWLEWALHEERGEP